ncbi:uncharacterized protein HMPREF1541_08905 [Cyphellophora europaea CBS 101466]|uniref:Uncharacterized protein n=1 Tax=Cyphellophora europaea (strain CBS 101466) TaxID=1220924 RepID=W2RJF7_CYPE1|nr:uncharacterized protein HMPREF1541_08905 [Cyphellophora europaea CBS 101466]ETN36627.1 hypothetical protein HMPREF1541_08905 [Cyphellophora europaea CBS 101466]
MNVLKTSLTVVGGWCRSRELWWRLDLPRTQTHASGHTSTIRVLITSRISRMQCCNKCSPTASASSNGFFTSVGSRRNAGLARYISQSYVTLDSRMQGVSIITLQADRMLGVSRPSNRSKDYSENAKRHYQNLCNHTEYNGSEMTTRRKNRYGNRSGRSAKKLSS